MKETWYCRWYIYVSMAISLYIVSPLQSEAYLNSEFVHTWLADYPALSVDRAGGGNPLYAEDTPNQEFLIWCAPIQEFLIRCTPIQEFEFTDSVLVFVRGVIWHQEGYYCYIISQMNTFIINKILPRKCLPLLTACRHLWQLHLVVLKFIQRNDTSRWRSFYCVRKL